MIGGVLAVLFGSAGEGTVGSAVSSAVGDTVGGPVWSPGLESLHSSRALKDAARSLIYYIFIILLQHIYFVYTMAGI